MAGREWSAGLLGAPERMTSRQPRPRRRVGKSVRANVTEFTLIAHHHLLVDLGFLLIVLHALLIAHHGSAHPPPPRRRSSGRRSRQFRGCHLRPLCPPGPLPRLSQRLLVVANSGVRAWYALTSCGLHVVFAVVVASNHPPSADGLRRPPPICSRLLLFRPLRPHPRHPSPQLLGSSSRTKCTLTLRTLNAAQTPQLHPREADRDAAVI